MNTLLHQAIIDKNLSKIKDLSQSNELHTIKNALGFTPLELALFLNYSDAVSILHPEPMQMIKIQHEGELEPQKYTSYQFQKLFGVYYTSHLKFPDYRAFTTVIKHCPILLRSWIGKENQELGLRYQKELEKGFVIDSVIKWIDPKIGYGLFACHDIAKGTYIGEYTGKVRPLSRARPDHNSYCFHYPTRFWSWDYYVVDALKDGNELRFINHSFDPNLEPICMLDRKILHIGFVTKRSISKGEEFTFDYGPDFWE